MSKTIVYFDQLLGYGKQNRDLGYEIDTSIEKKTAISINNAQKKERAKIDVFSQPDPGL